jgi:rare lipoprotein A
MKLSYLTIIVACIALVAGCACKRPVVAQLPRGSYTIKGRTYYPLKFVRSGFSQSGVASWYGPGFQGKKTASGETYNMHALTAAHNTLPLNTILKVTNLANNKEVLVRVNDRGPFVGDRLIDLSLAAATKLDMVSCGTVPVRVVVLRDSGTLLAAKQAPVLEQPSLPRSPNPFFFGSHNRILALLGG